MSARSPARGGRQSGARLRPERVRLGVGQCRHRQDRGAGQAQLAASARRARGPKAFSASPTPRRRRRRCRTACSRISPLGRRCRTPSSTRRSPSSWGGRPRTRICASARRLFARALEARGGLKIHTIHGFCERLLQRFPLESAVTPAFHRARRPGRGAPQAAGVRCGHRARRRGPGRHARPGARHDRHGRRRGMVSAKWSIRCSPNAASSVAWWRITAG